MSEQSWRAINALESIERYGFGRDIYAEHKAMGLVLKCSYGRSKFGLTKWYVMVSYLHKGSKLHRRVTMFKAYDFDGAMEYLSLPSTEKRIARMAAKRRAELQDAGYTLESDVQS